MTDVVVVGGGIIGLTAAARLRERGADVTVWSADAAPDTVSAVAAAVRYPTRTAFDPRILAWAAATYAVFREQAAAGVPGVLLRETRTLERTATAGAPWWASAAGDVRYLSAPQPWTREVRFLAPMAEMVPYLAWLGEGLRIRRRRVATLDEAFEEAPVVVNATGLAAATLGGDPAVHPVRGQIVLVANPGLTVSVRDEADPATSTYVHPRSKDIVLGGTYQEGAWSTAPDPAIREAILARCTALVPELAGAPVLGERVGLRPARHGGPRVETERRPGGTIVHAYGHGGAGMTLSWGCADEIAELCLTSAGPAPSPLSRSAPPPWPGRAPDAAR